MTGGGREPERLTLGQLFRFGGRLEGVGRCRLSGFRERRRTRIVANAESTAIDSFLAALAEEPVVFVCAVGLLAFVESLALVGIFTPGIAILAGASLAAGAAGIPLSALLFAGWLGAVLGDGVSFLVGHRYGPALREREAAHRYARWLERGDHFFARHGVTGVVIGRFLGPLRPVIPITAGMLGMDPRLFLTVNLASALAWSPAYLLPGYLVGASVGHALSLPAGWPLALVCAVAALWGAGQLTKGAWRIGERDGIAGRAVRGHGPAGRWLGASLTRSGGADTRLSVLLAAASLACCALLATVVVSRPAAAPWRDALASLWALVLHLW